jgi:hypothetical protein
VAFPGTYNFSYYQGDTLEFKVYPKIQSGQPLSGLSTFEAKFTIANSRGAGTGVVQYQGYTRIETDHIVCAITPDLLLPSGSLVYDVELSKTQASPYSLVYTLLTGNLTVTPQVTSGTFAPPVQAPGPVISVTAIAPEAPLGQNQINVSWQAPTTGGTPTSYVVRYALADDPTTDLGTVTKTSSEFSHPVTGLVPNTSYIFKVDARNSATVGTPNPVTVTATTLPEPPSTPTGFGVPTVTNSTIEITFGAPLSLNQTSYVFYLNEQFFDTADSPTATSFVFTGLTAGTSYIVGVAAANEGGAGLPASTTQSTSA